MPHQPHGHNMPHFIPICMPIISIHTYMSMSICIHFTYMPSVSVYWHPPITKPANSLPYVSSVAPLRHLVEKLHCQEPILSQDPWLETYCNVPFCFVNTILRAFLAHLCRGGAMLQFKYPFLTTVATCKQETLWSIQCFRCNVLSYHRTYINTHTLSLCPTMTQPMFTLISPKSKLKLNLLIVHRTKCPLFL